MKKIQLQQLKPRSSDLPSSSWTGSPWDRRKVSTNTFLAYLNEAVMEMHTKDTSCMLEVLGEFSLKRPSL
ncbi:hypothetical protein MPTK1_6g03500 [Marchantia polymorpha subsp. ruderalis]|uniref:Uncharacterized protein n=2 Tax=Marchantia polymorpha TaxID=3197 RepID=A0AAF6BN57_MARPO|nr:hypothetical protein MARPO_0035s0130 [Marchantia polymorpha]PTQ41362.1 hypothetical protein MARPO_0035s0130 [Marchantia polymorpha]BBN13440.1 hypothetical protein Mp_6g03500 [Marchantia polymorpha subsp. ruderalis]BBN13441.1 hypothetical protein Mp_6g03500 [Marchantia polymorpha subsp. ruderalis]|eukprot:PTQ41361.1 hypothetical protein MARPO_0035s0130 [Marchantia polymorpha]